jgi:hypothetical protein
MVRMRPGVVHKNHQRGCAGMVGDRDAIGSVEGCANSTVTCARTSTSRLLSRMPNLYEESLRADCGKGGDSGTSVSNFASARPGRCAPALRNIPRSLRSCPPEHSPVAALLPSGTFPGRCAPALRRNRATFPILNPCMVTVMAGC